MKSFSMTFNKPSFPMDFISFDAALKAHFGDAYNGSYDFGTYFRTLLQPVEANWQYVTDQLAALTSDGEAAKLAHNSRKVGKPKQDFEQAVKIYIANKDITTLTVAEKKFFMGAKLTDSEYDSLVTS